MRFMVIVKGKQRLGSGRNANQGDADRDGGSSTKRLVKAGVMLAAEGPHASSKGARQVLGRQENRDRWTFAETKELVAGFWLWSESKQEALDWLKRAPFEDTEVEIRQVFEAEDFGAEFTPPNSGSRSACKRRWMPRSSRRAWSNGGANSPGVRRPGASFSLRPH